MSVVRSSAEKVAAKLEAKGVKAGFGGLEWLPILMPLIQGLFGCLKDNDNVTEETAYSRIRTLHSKDPARLRNRVAKNARRKNRDLDKATSFEVADSMIEVALEADENEVSACMREVNLANAESDSDE